MAAEIIGAVLQPIINYLIIPFGRQLDYLFYYKTNISDIETRFKNLQKIRQDVQKIVEAAKRDLKRGIGVNNWLDKTTEIMNKVESILASKIDVKKGCLNGWCPNLKARYKTSRKSRKVIIEVDKLIEESKEYLKGSNPLGPTGNDRFLKKNMIEFESRKNVENQVITALRDVGTFAVGLWGMGGVGKTTMAIRISKIAKDENLFDEIVFVSVTNKLDEIKVQSDLAQRLGLTLEKDDLYDRANRIYARIMDTRKILIIIDDVWNHFDLYKIGIPSKGIHKGCKIMFTSRLRDMCQAIGVDKIFKISELPEMEARTLFKEKAGECVDNPQLVSIANDVMKECKGLPIAIITVAISLKDQKKPVWKDALLQLRKGVPQNMLLGVMNEVYVPLELSFRRLETDELKTFFLICSLFPEDSYILIDTLVRFGMGLGIFSGIESLIEARNRAHSLVEMLKDRSLLVDSTTEDEENHYAQMHDVIRDVALFIASKGKHVFLVSHDPNSNGWPMRKIYDHFTCISVISRAFIDLPEKLDCPKLEMLLLDCINQQRFNASESFFAGMKGLKVLELQEFSIVSFPWSFKLLTNLTTLHMHYCEFAKRTLETFMSSITELVNLEIVSFRYSNIKILPFGLGNLSNLRLLDVTGCKELNVIHKGMLLRLTRLEELYLKWSFTSWGTITEGRKSNASLKELESLSKLSSLELVFPEIHSIPMGLHFSQTLTRYEILVGMPSDVPKDVRKRFKKIMSFNLNSPTTPIITSPSILEMMKNTDYLYSKGDGSISTIESISKEDFKNLKQLHVSDCSILNHLINMESMDATPKPKEDFNNLKQPHDSDCSTLSRLIHIESMDDTPKPFPSLEKLFLEKVSSLRSLWNGKISSESFSNLKNLEFEKLPKLSHLWKTPNQEPSLSNLVSVYLNECDRLQHLFSQSVAQSLVLLERLKIKKCQRMEQVISKSNQDENTDNLVKFPRLHDLLLDNLEELTGFCNNLAGIQLKQLRCLNINTLPKLKCFTGEGKDSSSGESKDNDLPSLFDDKIEFLCLTILKINEFAAHQLCSRRLKNGSFNELEVLKISSSNNLKNLFTSSVAKGFSKLKELVVERCSKMEEVIAIDEEENQKKEISLFPQLESLKLDMLEELKRFCQAKKNLELKLLENVEIKSCPKLQTFNQGSLSTPCLKALSVDGSDFQVTQINDVIQQEYQKKAEMEVMKKTYFNISASDLIVNTDDWTLSTEHEANGESFVVVELHNAQNLEVWGKLEKSRLVFGLTYEIVFVIMLREPVRGWDDEVSLRLILPNGGGIMDKKISLRTKARRKYIEIKVGEFKIIEEDNNEGDIEFAILQQNKNLIKRGLVIKGAIIRQKPQVV